uniref:Uncharacterized protein n=1 Tax=Paramoeba aestuarina TaxID=180227 RepID=A0A7S4L993_9EUKA|mmetsp:Transcript_33769/g.52820  ORF Transcript_33769/g.52820 Transcript_33769/m.52820 type:complete len:200 (+) Transcript_33769:48-647(+)
MGQLLADLREAQEEFLLQMHSRDRTGEELLPLPGRQLCTEPVYFDEHQSMPQKASAEAFGPRYESIKSRRDKFEIAKRNIHRILKLLSETNVSNTPSSSSEERTKIFEESYIDFFRVLREIEKHGDDNDVPVIALLTSCMEIIFNMYGRANAEDTKIFMTEVTGKFLAPVFRHQQRLLHELKAEKKPLSVSHLCRNKRD